MRDQCLNTLFLSLIIPSSDIGRQLEHERTRGREMEHLMATARTHEHRTATAAQVLILRGDWSQTAEFRFFLFCFLIFCICAGFSFYHYD
jgi:hypothetical protein